MLGVKVLKLWRFLKVHHFSAPTLDLPVKDTAYQLLPFLEHGRHASQVFIVVPNFLVILYDIPLMNGCLLIALNVSPARPPYPPF